MAINTIKKLTLSLSGDQVECQLSNCVLEDTSSPEELTSFCSVESVANPPAYQLTVGGWQDYGAATSVLDMLHEAYVADPIEEIDAVMEVGSKSRTFSVKPTADVPFGGEAGILTFEATLSVTSDVVDGTVTP